METKMYWIINNKIKCIFFISLLLFSSLYSLDIDVFRLKQKNAFTNERIEFSTIIPGVPPSQIDLTVQSLPQDVSFVGSKKEKIIFNALESTNVELYFIISKTGKYKISSVPVRIRYGYQYVGFEAIEVTDNPKSLEPKILYTIREKQDENDLRDRGFAGDRALQSIERGKCFELLLEAQYFATIQALSWHASENSIVYNERLLQKLPYQEADFNANPVPVALFDFIALEEGKVFLPELVLQGKTWAGVDFGIVESNKTIAVSKAIVKKAVVGTEDYKDYEKYARDGFEIVLGTEDLNNALGTEDYKEDYKDYEKYERSGQFGLGDDEKKVIIGELEKSIVQKKQLLKILSRLFFGLCIFFVILRLLFIRSKKKVQFLLPLALSFLICYFLLHGLAKQKWLVFDGTFYTIPEQNARVLQVVEKPIVVQVLLETKDWVHIAYPILKTKKEAQYAWVKKSDIQH